MAASKSTGSSSSSSTAVVLSSEDGFQQVLNERKRKRMVSNREAARRSRMRKQKRLDDLMGQVSQLTNENDQILTNIGITRQVYLNIEAENMILRAQMDELTARLQSLHGIIDFLNSSSNIGGFGYDHHHHDSYEAAAAHDHHHHYQFNGGDTFVNNNNNPYWGCCSVNQPFIASTDMIMY